TPPRRLHLGLLLLPGFVPNQAPPCGSATPQRAHSALALLGQRRQIHPPHRDEHLFDSRLPYATRAGQIATVCSKTLIGLSNTFRSNGETSKTARKLGHTLSAYLP